MKIGILINNIGTPASPTPEKVGEYLREFLMDPEVINLPFFIRYPLVNWLIVPKRKFISAENYKKVWTAQGSPLRYLSEDFCTKLQNRLGDKFVVRLGMNYGEPNLEKALLELSHEAIDLLIFCPMFPQHAEATTGAAKRTFSRILKKMNWGVSHLFLPPFFRNEDFLDWHARQLNHHVSKVTHVLFSYHGLPESQVKKIPGCLTNKDCCEDSTRCLLNCYRAQCFETSRHLALRLGLKKSQYTVAFQSRLGRAEWIKPYSQDAVEEIAKNGCKNLLVVSPAFVTDCLETLEEIKLGLAETFTHAGGNELIYSPAPNASDDWVEGFSKILMGVVPK